MDSGGMSSRAIDSMKKRMRREDARREETPRKETPREETPREKQAGAAHPRAAADLEGLLRHPALWRRHVHAGYGAGLWRRAVAQGCGDSSHSAPSS